MLQTQWASSINPVLTNPLINGIFLKNIALINGTTIINHRLQRDIQGYLIVGINAAATIFDNQATNQSPDLTLSLTSNAACIVNLYVF